MFNHHNIFWADGARLTFDISFEGLILLYKRGSQQVLKQTNSKYKSLLFLKGNMPFFKFFSYIISTSTLKTLLCVVQARLQSSVAGGQKDIWGAQINYTLIFGEKT